MTVKITNAQAAIAHGVPEEKAVAMQGKEFKVIDEITGFVQLENFYWVPKESFTRVKP